MKFATVVVCISALLLAAKYLKIETRCTKEAAYTHGCFPEKIELNYACVVTEIKVVRK